MYRQNNTSLPGNDELTRILHTEAAYAIPQKNEALHFPDFTFFKELLAHYDEPTSIFGDAQTIHQVVAEGASLLDRLVPKLLQDQTSEECELFNTLYDYLSEEDSPQQSDLLFVFGARTPLRAEKAAELYRQGIASTVILSGGNPIYHTGSVGTEASNYRAILVNAGIPEAAIVTEPQSITVPDNVRRSLTLLKERQIHFDSITIVNSPYAQRRGWAIFKKHLPQHVKLHRVNSDCAEKYKKENWYKQEETLRVILNEYIKMRASVVYNTA